MPNLWGTICDAQFVMLNLWCPMCVAQSVMPNLWCSICDAQCVMPNLWCPIRPIVFPEVCRKNAKYKSWRGCRSSFRTWGGGGTPKIITDKLIFHHLFSPALGKTPSHIGGGEIKPQLEWRLSLENGGGGDFQIVIRSVTICHIICYHHGQNNLYIGDGGLEPATPTALPA